MNKRKSVELLMEITVQALTELVSGDEGIGTFVLAKNHAVSTRKIVNKVQFEEEWQQQIDDSEVFYVFTTLKLAPNILQIAGSKYQDLNRVSWNLIVPNTFTLEPAQRPTNSIELLMMAKLMLEEIQGGHFSYEELVEFLQIISRIRKR
ncbi:hypothetical protein [Polynucleobacter sp. AM-25C3]|uniref:hypothetical protein n=1 Tax=Polynucleobacter sp. AM-25C3 TaxID=1855569 RepID=UPI001C0BEF39|nr:hypothetical protein [Polynucleobacter sp. AM-25C3]MBU3602084.1 hypothetical protein [Polynucleobacter sp. AM-25C3]